MSGMPELPAKARAKLETLFDAENDARDLLMATNRRISELSHALATSSESTAANMEHEISRLRAKMGLQQTRHQSIAGLNAQIRLWLDQVSGFELEAVKRVRVRLKNESASEAIRRLRGEIAAVKAERGKVQRAAPTIGELKAAASEYVAGLSAKGKPMITAEHGTFGLRFGGDSFTARVDVPSILAWFDGNALTERLHAEIDAMPKPALAMSSKDKAAKEAELTAALAAAEGSEEDLIAELEERGEGPVIQRRQDASPSAILGVAKKLKARAAAPAAA